MSKHYQDYIWRNGIPYGVAPCTPEEHPKTYKVVSDPYYKRNSIEVYESGIFRHIIYDSALFDFRMLRPDQQTAWEKKDMGDGIAHIHNQDDRLVLIEEYSFEGQYCRRCDVRSSHGVPVAVQQMFYTALNDPFDGVILYDTNTHPVLKKVYDLDKDTGAFATLLSESWSTP